MKKPLFSVYRVLISKEQKNVALSSVMENNLVCKSTRINESKELELIIKKKDKKAFEDIFKNLGINGKFEEIDGYLKPIECLRKRYGLIFGFIFLILLLQYSSRIVWKIEVNGLNNVDEQDVLNQLESAGLSLGTYVPGIDYDELHNKVLLNSKNLSWISVNIVGNVATVEVKEKINHSEQKEPLYTNIVAKSDGYIESIVVIDGKKTVKKGDVVKEGDILISGIINSQAEGVRYEQAKGEIKAYVRKNILIKIPFASTKKEYTGRKYTTKSYKIYNFPINFLSKYGNQALFYDTIEKKEKLSFLGISSIPVEIKTAVHYEYVMKDVRLTVAEAVDLAFSELRLELDAKLSGAELVSKETKTYRDSDAFYVECELYCLEDIAKEQEFFVTK